MTRGRWAGAVVLVLAAWLGTRLLGASEVASATTAAQAERWDDAVAALSAPSSLPPSVTNLVDRGVIHYRRGDLPRALAAWRAARELAPRDPDLVHDLALARSELPPGLPPPVGPRLAWMELITPGEVGLLALLAWIAAGAATSAWRREGEGLPIALVAAAVAATLSGAALAGRHAHLTEPPGVVLEEAVARDAADLQAGQRFLLPAGAEVRAEARRGLFLRVVDGEGRRGWVFAESVDVADPGWL